jgi:photosystem II stability/assembly factor-like uncharacterized protein
VNWRHAVLAVATVALATAGIARADERPVGQMRWRAIGPALPEGRASAVVGSDKNPLLYYAGTADGGVWKSTDGGTSWQNISDYIHLGSVGAIAVDPNDDTNIYVGAGETNPRNDVIPESGLYHSTNGGRSWKTIPFPNAPGISRILLDPKDPKHIIVGVLGDVFAPSSERGAYVSFDGGLTFAKTLYTADQTGVSDMAMDPANPLVVYAGMWHALRRPWQMTSGGTPDDGLYKSVDGGKTWSRVTGGGFPVSPLGRISVAFAPSNPARMYAMVESKNGLLWRSDDAGATWTLTTKDTTADQRPFYFTHVRVSPTNPNTVYGLSLLLATSFDGGEKFNLSAFGVHSDLHDMWISSDAERMALAGDGGIAISANGGSTWANSRNLPIAQVYRVGLSDTAPYFVCGGLQDNNGYCGPAFNGNMDGVTNREWFKVVEGDGEWAVPDPTNPRRIWADSENGEVVIYDRISHASINIKPFRETAAEDFVLAKSQYRFNWQSPIAFAAYDPHLAFIGANVVFATNDDGKHWAAISPDLTRNDKSKQQGDTQSVTQDSSGAEYYATILDIESSAKHKGEIWTGSDDGLVYLTLDGGKHWRNVTPADLPTDSAVETVAPSTLADGTAYISADRHAMGDDSAYIYVTHDFGAHWQKITSGLAAGEYVRAVRPDIHNPQIVYAGTNQGVRISCDGGASWQSFQNNLPKVEVRDIRMQPKFDDLVIATHGRAIWVMDDVRPVQLSACAKPTSPLVIGPRDAYALIGYRDDEGNYTDFVAAQPGGGFGLGGGGPVAKVYYWLPKEAKKRPTIDVYDAKGHLVRHIEGEHDVYTGQVASSYWISNSDGKNEFLYDLSIDGVPRYTSTNFFFRGPDAGPTLPPGHYMLVFHLDGTSYRLPVNEIADPLDTTPQAEREAAFLQERRLYDLYGRIDVMLNTLHDTLVALNADKAALKPGDPNAANVQSAIDSANALVDSLTSNPQSFEDFIQKPGALREDVQSLMGQEPLAQASLQLYARLEKEYTIRATAYNAWTSTLPALNATLTSSGAKPLAVPSKVTTGPNKLAPIVTH